jgi:hypothetical protein
MDARVKLQYMSGASDEVLYLVTTELDRLNEVWNRRLNGKGEATTQIRFRSSQQAKDQSKTVALDKIVSIEVLDDEPKISPNTLMPQKGIVESEFDDEDGANTLEA